MCGIAGWVNFRDPNQHPELLRAMTDTLIRRGPDGEGYLVDGPVHLGHRRLSIIDLAGGDQPISNEDDTVWIVFNGEIFNFQGLRSKLVAKYRFKTNGDTETILHAYSEYGMDFVDHLRGQFSIAIWDKRKQQLVLARDRMGQKPLYYHEAPGLLVFGSELKAVLMHPSVQREIDPVALDAYFAHGFVPDPLTIFKNVKKLPPAYIATFGKNGLQMSRYWHPGFSQSEPQTPNGASNSNGSHGLASASNEQEALDQLDHLLEESVGMRMISDVPLGAFLSGGIDSSLIVAYMCRVSNQKIKTFNIGFEEQSHDERPYADQVARLFSTDHHQFVVRPDATKVLDELVDAFDEPFADSSALAVYYLSQMTREHVTVALNGDGGDESFAGYRRYQSAINFSRFQNLPSPIRKSAHIGVGLVNKIFKGRIGAAKRFGRWSGYQDLSIGEVYQLGVTLPVDTRDSLYTKSFLDQLKTLHRFDGVKQAINQSRCKNLIDKILEAEQTVYLPGDLLVKVDRMTMWHSLEGRSPFLDHKIVEFAAQLKVNLKYPNGKLKHLLKQLALRYFPKEFVHRKKMGFGVPLASWFRNELKPLMEDAISDSHLVSSGYLNPEGIKRIYNCHLAGQADYSSVLWSILNLELWFRKLSKPNCPSTTVGS